jgi:hypothetical protein
MELTVPEIKQKMQDNYAFFCLILQEDGWFDPMHKKLCDWIQSHVERGLREEKDVKLLITMPRGSLKTTIVTKYFSTWMAIRDPNVRCLIATNTHTNARKKLEDIRGLFDSHETFRAIYPELLPTKKCIWTNECAVINRSTSFPEGTFEAAGMKTKKTGTHYNIILEDDTTAPDEDDMAVEVTTPSHETIENAIGWHKNATPLLVPKGIRIRLVVTTRWSEFDLVDYLRKNEDYRMFNVPALDDKGNPYFVNFYPKEKLDEIRDQIGPYMFSCLYLNAPLDPSLRVFQDSWLNWVRQSEVPYDDPVQFNSIAIDPAISEKDEACETAITKVIHSKRGTRWHQYWTRDIHGHLNPNETANKALDLCDETTKAIIVETNAYQAALKYILRDEMISRGLHFNIIAVPSRVKKTERIYAMEPFFANGYVHLVQGLTNQVESQLKQFPNGRLVDIIDCFSMHMKVYKGLRIEAPIVQKKFVNPFSYDVVLDELKKSKREAQYCLQSGLSVSAIDDDYCALTTGLGDL